MPFIVPLLVPLIGVFAANVVTIGAAFGLSYLATRLAPKPSAVARATGRTLRLEIATNVARRVIFGRAATAGSLVYWQTTGKDNKLLQMVVALADHECEGLVELWVDGKKRSWNSDTGEVSDHEGKLTVRFYNGASGQDADEAVRDASEGRWTDAETGQHICYAVIEAEADEEVFTGGIPQIVFVIEGAKLYDPRLDSTVGGNVSHRWGDKSTWTFSDNPAVAIYSVLRGIAPGGVHLLGLNSPADAIRIADFEAAANACDEPVDLKAGGTEPRYRCGVTIGLDQQPNRDALEALIAAMAGEVISSGGIYRIMAGVARASVANLTDDDLIAAEPFVSEPRMPRSELTNAVFASFSDPSRSYEAVPLPPRTSSADEATDGGIRLAQTFDFVAITSRTQAQRVMEIARRRARRQIRVKATIRSRWFTLEPGDWITLTSARRGYESRVFEIDHTKVNHDLTSDIVIREMDAGFDDWSTGDEIADNERSNLLPGGPTLTFVSNLAVAATVIAGASGAQRPGLRATWEPIDDPTVTGIIIEYRKVGDTVALEKNVLDPSTGQHTWLEGIQGSVSYEIRAIPQTQPERTVDWTAWVRPAEQTAPSIVDVAADVIPGSISKEDLDPQARYELSLVTAVDDVLGSVASGLAESLRETQTTAESTIRGLITGKKNETAITVEREIRQSESEAFAQQITKIQAAIGDDIAAALLEEQTARVDGDSALAKDLTLLQTSVDGNTALVASERTARTDADSAQAKDITALQTSVGDNTALVAVVKESIDGISGKFAVVIDVKGNIVGAISLDGKKNYSTFSVVANKFLVAFPDQAGGNPVSVFSIQDVNGVAKLALRGDMYADGAILARHLSVTTLSAITANIGRVTAGVMQSADGLFIIDLDKKELTIDSK